MGTIRVSIFKFVFKTTARRISSRVSAGIGSVFLIQPTGQKRKEKILIFLERGPHASVPHTAFSKHDAILQRIQPWPPKNPIPTKKNKTSRHFVKRRKYKNTKI